MFNMSHHKPFERIRHTDLYLLMEVFCICVYYVKQELNPIIKMGYKHYANSSRFCSQLTTSIQKIAMKNAIQLAINLIRIEFFFMTF